MSAGTPRARAASSRPPTAAGRCLVVGYDRTDAGRRAASWAARDLGGEGRLVLVHADRPQHAPPSPLASRQERRELGRAIVDELLLEGDDALHEVELEVEISDRDPASALSEAAVRHGASAIVVGSGRHSRLRRALGTVTSELLASSPVPVTAVPQDAGPS
jgi:nucleotide-binding universal stress UspA family protein